MIERWPRLDEPGWEATRDHLQLWAQMLGKTRLAFAPHVNHWWQVPLYVSPRGLTTGAVPAPDGRNFDLELDLLAHRLVARSGDGCHEELPLVGGSIADFYDRYLHLLDAIEVHPALYTHPVEVEVSIPFEEDDRPRPYDPGWATAFFGALTEIDRLLQVFRGAFIGKASPVHFFWGGFDLAATRFSGRRAPRHRGGIPNCPDRVQVEAYSHECSSAGFWPGTGGASKAALYSYAYPQPPGFEDALVLPSEAFYSHELGEFILPYEAVRDSMDPDRLVLNFLQTTYAAAADFGDWNRAELERSPAEPALEETSWISSVNTSSSSSSIHPV